ncbi:MAG: tRNA (guanine(46)-N(7))-methyltransferase [Pseudolabrys sp.]|jgi:tRNA (guanine-N7-)-methyltransferase|nr:tRNA (guanine(46)-N(7))-methyltransferase [Pseudolabrys sp.]
MSRESAVPDHDHDSEKRAFFGRRKGHPLRAHQAALYDTLLPRLALDLATPAPLDLSDLFAAPVDDVRLEIGFGGGEHFIAQAAAQPRTGFIGIEPFVNGMAKALAALEERSIANVRLSTEDATHIIDWLPAGSLSRIDLLYPDPWPKRRHWKRRFVQNDMLARLARLLKRDGEFRFATDIGGYAAWTLARVSRSSDFEWIAERADDWRNPWPGFVRTRYEAKAIREGRTPAYFIFRKV